MKKIAEKEFGECIFCGVIGQGKKNFVCENCGKPDKLMMVCQCGQRHDLTKSLGMGVSDVNEYLSTIIAWNKRNEKYLKLGMTIYVARCVFCGGKKALKKEAAKDLMIYKISERIIIMKGRGAKV